MTLRQSMRTMVLGLMCVSASAEKILADEAVVMVRGDITVDGRPVVSGRIFFYLDDGQFVGGKIRDGAYKVTRVPVGACRISIEGQRVPAKVALEDSGFTAVVKAGPNEIDFDLKGR